MPHEQSVWMQMKIYVEHRTIFNFLFKYVSGTGPGVSSWVAFYVLIIWIRHASRSFGRILIFGKLPCFGTRPFNPTITIVWWYLGSGFKFSIMIIWYCMVYRYWFHAKYQLVKKSNVYAFSHTQIYIYTCVCVRVCVCVGGGGGGVCVCIRVIYFL